MTTVDVVFSLDNTFIKKVEMDTLEQAQAKLDLAHKTFLNKNAWLKHHQRVDILNKLIDLVLAEADDFALTISKESGKPLVDAKVEVIRAVDTIKLSIKEMMHSFKGEEIPMGFSKSSENKLAFTTKEPIGVVLALSSFNHPLNMPMHQIVPAIAVGCPVILKPASKTPLSAIRLVELIHKAGLPKEWCQFSLFDNTTSETIISSNKIAFVSFIGSERVGWMLRNKMAKGTRYALEHGGNAAAIIDENIDNIDEVVASVVKGAYYHAGQVCISTKRLFVHEKIYNTFVEKLTTAVKKLKVGDPTDINTEVGPLITDKEVDRIDTWVKEAVSEGAMLAAGGIKISSKLYSATLLLEPSQKSKVSQMEPFGPVLSVYKYNDLANAIDIVNSINLPFQGAIFSNNLNVIMQAYKHIDAAAVVVNDHTAFRVDWMPFAGRRSAGVGSGGVADTMHEMLNYKMIIIKSPAI